MPPRLYPEFLVVHPRTRYHTTPDMRDKAQKVAGEALTIVARLVSNLAPRGCHPPRVSEMDILPVLYDEDGVGHIVTETMKADGTGKPTIPAECLAGMRERKVSVGHPAYRPETGKLRPVIVVTVEWQTKSGEDCQALFGFPADFRRAVESGEWRSTIELRLGVHLKPREEYTLSDQVLLRRMAGVVFTRVREIKGKTSRWRFEGFVCDGKVEDGKFGRLFGTPVVWDAEHEDAAPLHKPQYVRFDTRLDHLLVREHFGAFTAYNVEPPAAERKAVAVEENEVADLYGNVFGTFDVLAPFGIENEDGVYPSRVAAARASFSPHFNAQRDVLAQVMFGVYRGVYAGLSGLVIKTTKITGRARTALFEAALAKAEANFLKEEPPTPPEDERPASTPAYGERASAPATEDVSAPADAEPVSEPAGETPPAPADESAGDTTPPSSEPAAAKESSSPDES